MTLDDHRVIDLIPAGWAYYVGQYTRRELFGAALVIAQKLKLLPHHQKD